MREHKSQVGDMRLDLLRPKLLGTKKLEDLPCFKIIKTDISKTIWINIVEVS